MKRELLCEKCGTRIKSIKESKHGELSKVVEGKLKAEGLVCDSCDKDLKVGEKVYALSIWTTSHGIKYSPWEKSYLTEDKP